MPPSILVHCKTRQDTKTAAGKKYFPKYSQFSHEKWEIMRGRKNWQNFPGLTYFFPDHDKLWPGLCRCRQFIFGLEHFAKTSKHHHPRSFVITRVSFIQNILSNFSIFFSKTSTYHSTGVSVFRSDRFSNGFRLKSFFCKYIRTAYLFDKQNYLW